MGPVSLRTYPEIEDDEALMREQPAIQILTSAKRQTLSNLMIAGS
jgi:hypothetical protein